MSIITHKHHTNHHTKPIINHTKPAFTIVELLVVIVVIAILAAVSTVVYMGIQDRASDAVVQSDLSQFYKHIQAEGVISGNMRLDVNNNDLDIETRTYNYPDDGSAYISTALTPSGRAKVEAYLGSSLSRASYYTKDEYVFMIEFRWEWIDSIEISKPILYARSKSGKVFMNDGSLTRVIGGTDADRRTYLEEEIAWAESYIRDGDTCTSGAGCQGDWSDEDAVTWADWWNSSDGKAWYEQYLVDLRTDLKNVNEGNPSLVEYRPRYSDAIYYSAEDDTWYHYQLYYT